jgi:hypothetical protein
VVALVFWMKKNPKFGLAQPSSIANQNVPKETIFYFCYLIRIEHEKCSEMCV